MTSSPRLDFDDLQVYADRYSYAQEDSVLTLVDAVRARGFLTGEELVVVGEWKSPRIRSRLARNSDALIREVTRAALAADSVRLAVHVPQALFGVGMPVASTILHWFHRDPFPILDFRALWSMGIEKPSFYTLEFWEQYVQAVRSLAGEWTTDIRTLDRALWQFSAENQV